MPYQQPAMYGANQLFHPPPPNGAPQRTLWYVLYISGSRWREGELGYVKEMYDEWCENHPHLRITLEEHLIRRLPGQSYWKLIRRSVLKRSHPNRHRWAAKLPIWHM